MAGFVVLLLGLVIHPVGAGVHELVYGTPNYREEPTSVALPDVEEGLEPLPEGYSLGPCRPNPFNTKLFVPFSLGRDGEVRIKVFSSDGRLVRSFSGRFRASEKVVLVK